MNGSGHYALAAQHAKVAAELYDDGDTARGDGRVRLALVHVGLAQAAATALGAVLPLVGGDCTEVTEWARAIGALDEPSEPDYVVEAVIHPEHWPPTAGDVWANWNSRWFAQRVPEAIQMVPAYTGSDLSPNVPCSPEELLKRDSTLTLVSREEPPF